MPKVQRRLVVEGEHYVIECAVRADGVTCPAWEFLECLAKGMWAEDLDATSLPDDAQLEDRDKFLYFCYQLANTGEPAHGTAVNYLVNGIWEFKRGKKRLAFHDTPGDGTYTPKLKGDGGEHTAAYRYWWFPNFDEYVRLGHAFPKLDAQTEDFDIEEALAIRTEDLQHDRVE